ncbi:DUF378 domain-containing protein [Psychrobacillus sp. NEAU-3TGS]|uniref:DUF378 domain-containing protein n=1 Tax=Psychrobacillus sp. NEAU-3TGS TaxID=2995412 RepID=UPI0024986B26|nr:DUF378 domain-containing protein [Psychrobacillus sp. NEAU-3TGS]MDI2586676.1 DUF378 domain-containing protein [Psychrobacillus sp. NEAU-3TGS]
MRAIHRIALLLVIIGAINWGLIGFFRYDLVASIFGGQTSGISRFIYALVGLSGLICLPLLFEPSRDVEVERDTRGIRNVNYGTEFGEETDLTDIRDYSERKKSEEKK